MKKILIIALAIIVMAMFSACGSKNSSPAPHDIIEHNCGCDYDCHCHKSPEDCDCDHDPGSPEDHAGHEDIPFDGNPCDIECVSHPETGECHCHGHCGTEGCQCHGAH